jgi:hypothetical protein
MKGKGPVKNQYGEATLKVDGAVKKIVIMEDFSTIKIEDKGSRKEYRINRSLGSGGLQMVAEK